MADTPSDVVGGRYRVLGALGKGAMGLVFMAYDPVLDRKVAIKQMTAEIADNEELRKRFYVEARAAARLNHPNIITIHELHESGGDIFMIMELLEGKSLAALIQAKPVPLSIEATLDVMAQVCDGLDYAHQRTIVHRDIKPANLFLTPSGTVKVLDFGIARLGSMQMTAAGALIGTPDYMSPEQIRGDEIDRRTDLWAIGAVLYQLLSGTKPFEGKPLAKLLTAIAQSPHMSLRQRAPSVPPSVSDLVDRLLSKPRDGRPASAALVRDELRAILGRESTSSTKATLAEDEYEETVFMAAPPKAAPKPPAAPPVPATAPSAPPAAQPPSPMLSSAAEEAEVEATVLMKVPAKPVPAAPRTAATPAPAAVPPLPVLSTPVPPTPVPPVPAHVATAGAGRPEAAASAVPPPMAPPAPAVPSVKSAVPSPPVRAAVTAAPVRTPAGAATAAAKPASKGVPVLVAVALVAVLALAVVGGAAWWYLRGSAPSPAQAESTGVLATTPASSGQRSEPPVLPAAAGASGEAPSPAPAGAPSSEPPATPSVSQAAEAEAQPAAASAATAQAATEPAGQVPAGAPPVPPPASSRPAPPPNSPAPAATPSAAAPAAARPPERAAAGARSSEGGVETGVAAGAAARPGVTADTLDAFKGRTSGGSDSAATLAAVNRINYVLEQYVQALVNADADAIKVYRPSLSAEETALMRARQLKVRLEDLRVEVNGNEAQARCRRKLDGSSATGTRIQEDGPVTFRLTRRPAGWVITDVR